MNRFIKLLPKPLLQRYVRNNFSKFTVEDFFDIVEKVDVKAGWFVLNSVLSSKPEVLSYMLDKNKQVFSYFQPEAFTLENVNKIADIGSEIFPFEIEKFPILLQNEKIRDNAILKKGELIRYLEPSLVDEKVISILENNNTFIPDEDLIDSYPMLLSSEVLMKRAVSANSSLVLKMSKPTDLVLDVAFKSGYIPKREDLSKNPLLKNSNVFLLEVFKYDPSVISLFNQDLLTLENVESARTRGYIASRQDLEANSSLCNNEFIMEDAINNSPELITLVGDNLSLSYECIINALQKYTITEQDLINNPSIANFDIIINHYPNFALYKKRLTDDVK